MSNARRIYLSAAEVRVLNEALTKWHNWSFSDMEPWEDDAYGKLSHKLYERDEFEPPTQPSEPEPTPHDGFDHCPSCQAVYQQKEATDGT